MHCFRRFRFIDGSWTRYGPYSDCSRECGGGITVAVRQCSMPPPTNGGKECPGPNMDVKQCNQQPCPCGTNGTFDHPLIVDVYLSIDGQWGNWNTWGACNQSCGIGYRKRTRVCNSPPPNRVGQECAGEGTESISCLVVDCPQRWCTLSNIP
jgi:hemicentin